MSIDDFNLPDLDIANIAPPLIDDSPGWQQALDSALPEDAVTHLPFVKPPDSVMNNQNLAQNALDTPYSPFDLPPHQWDQPTRDTASLGMLHNKVDQHFSTTGQLPEADTLNRFRQHIQNMWDQLPSPTDISADDTNSPNQPPSDQDGTKVPESAPPQSPQTDEADAVPADPELTEAPQIRQPTEDQDPSQKTQLAADTGTISDANNDIRRTPTPPQADDPALLDKAKERTKAFEGTQKNGHAYTDSQGHVTFDPGMKVDNEDQMKALDLIKPDGTMASEAEKTAEYNNVKNGGNATLKMSPQLQDKLFTQKVTEHMQGARRELGEDTWSKMTDGQKLVATDIHYAKGSLGSFEEFTKGARTGDAQKMATESSFVSKDANKNPVYNIARVRDNYAQAKGIPNDAPEITEWMKGKAKN